MIFKALSLNSWYSLLVKVWLGATTIESPVWTPTGSKFSILQMVMAVSLWSLITSYSISLYPLILFSTNTWLTGESFKACFNNGFNSCSLSANPPPVPPKVKAGLRTTGYPILLAATIPSSSDSAIIDSKTGSPNSWHSSLNFSLSSAFSILSLLVPKSSTWHSCKIPFLYNCIAIFNPVCPPIPGKIASGLSYLIILATYSNVSGSIYTLSAIAVSVIIVAGLEFTNITLYPSSFSAKQACVPA